MLKTITINTETHKVVPLYPTAEMVAKAQFHTEHSALDEDDENHYRAKGQALAVYSEMIEAAPEFTGSAWVNSKDRLPDVKAGNCAEFIVHARPINGVKTYVFAAMYLNEMELDDAEEGYERPFTGWHSAKEHHDYDIHYEALSSHEILHWMPLPPAPEGI